MSYEEGLKYALRRLFQVQSRLGEAAALIDNEEDLDRLVTELDNIVMQLTVGWEDSEDEEGSEYSDEGELEDDDGEPVDGELEEEEDPDEGDEESEGELEEDDDDDAEVIAELGEDSDDE